jgi:YbbR domain-containing protein
VRVDLSKAVEGRNSFPVTQADIILPPGVSLNKIQPATIDVTLDMPAARELPVQVDWVGRLPENITLRQVSVSPDTLKVIGGSKILDKTATVYTSPVRLDNLPKSGSVTAQVVLSPPSLKLAPSSPDRVTVQYRLEEKGAEKKGG